MDDPLPRGLTLRHLRLVSTLGRTLNLSRCAAAVHTTQPAASRALAQLESVLGARLFDRTSRRVVPTAAGLALIQHAERILNELGRARTAVRDARAGQGGPLRVGVLTSFCPIRVAAAVARLGERMPQVRVELHAGAAADLLPALEAGRLELMLSHAEFAVDHGRIVVQPLYDERSAVVAAPSHRLARRARVGWAEVADERWVLPAPGAPLRPKLDRILSVHRRADRRRPPDVQCDAMPTALALVREHGTLWAIAERHAWPFERDGLVRRLAVPEPLLQGPMCAFTRRDAPDLPAVDLLVRTIAATQDPAPAAAPPVRRGGRAGDPGSGVVPRPRRRQTEAVSPPST